ncbi:flagellar basal-body rod protein FlgG [Novimethylophilus kurashikiensis]|uniref:Flagellar basal-body rod protein FlgG n=1 Tax=Novimethylophilus kurashikiensis TaxID=1825523 RepID=A0A2R5FHL0_9PROT|nr:flagellar basal-body rod protein FlgG [Novimethylophilus kurashikiensis]GBG15823.1 flagellar basal-body rod protein FlgG [Novimethylophilus kurashikiensis]
MLRSLWIAKTGMESQQTNIDVISHNLANVATNGFKRSRPVFEDLIYQTLRQPGAQASQQNQIPSGLQLGTGARPVATERIHIQGNLQQTGNSLDLAVSGNGFFQVQLSDGTLAYTRDGSFQVNSEGTVVTANGDILQPQITIPNDAISVTVAKDGTVTIVQTGNVTSTQGPIQLSNFINPAGLQSVGDNLYLETVASGTPNTSNPGSNGLGSLNQGFVETSNVNVTEELVNMITAQRAYEINSKAITASDQMLQRLVQM